MLTKSCTTDRSRARSELETRTPRRQNVGWRRYNKRLEDSTRKLVAKQELLGERIEGVGTWQTTLKELEASMLPAASTKMKIWASSKTYKGKNWVPESLKSRNVSDDAISTYARNGVHKEKSTAVTSVTYSRTNPSNIQV